MPLYSYRCPACGHHEDQLRAVNHRNEVMPCPECEIGYDPEMHGFAAGPQLWRDQFAETAHTDTGYHTPILSEALGVDPTQINAAKQKFPHHNFTPDGRMILTSHTERKRVLADLGFRDWQGFTG